MAPSEIMKEGMRSCCRNLYVPFMRCELFGYRRLGNTMSRVRSMKIPGRIIRGTTRMGTYIGPIDRRRLEPSIEETP